jgi:hypothetical protein
MLPPRRALLGALVALALLAPAGVLSARADDPPVTAPSTVWGDFAPAFPGDIVVRQPDGTSFKAQLTGAEIGGGLEVDGYTVTKGDDGWWTYEGSSARAGHDAPPAGLARGVGRTPSLWVNSAGADIRTQALRQLQAASWKASQQAAAAGQPRVFRFPVLMLAKWWDTS